MPEPTLEMISNLADMSCAAYKHNGGTPPNANWEKMGVFNPDHIVSPLSAVYDYQIVAFRHVTDKTIVLAHRGTVQSISNWVVDNIPDIGIKNFFKSGPANLPDFVAYSKLIHGQIRIQYPGYSIVNTGHSLGAGTATVVAATEGELAIVFDSPGVHNIIMNNTVLKHEYLQHKGLVATGGIYIYQSTPNAVNQFGKQLTTAAVNIINPYADRPAPLGIDMTNLSRGHSIKLIANYFRRCLTLANEGRVAPPPNRDVPPRAPMVTPEALLSYTAELPPVCMPRSENDTTFLKTQTISSITNFSSVQSGPTGVIQTLFSFAGSIVTLFSGISAKVPAAGNHVAQPTISNPPIPPTPPTLLPTAEPAAMGLADDGYPYILP